MDSWIIYTCLHIYADILISVFIAPSWNVKCLRRWFLFSLMADFDIVFLNNVNVISRVSFFIDCFQYAQAEGRLCILFLLVSSFVQHLTVFQWSMEPSAGPGLNPRRSRGTYVFAILTYVFTVHQGLLGQLQYCENCSGKVSNTKSFFKTPSFQSNKCWQESWPLFWSSTCSIFIIM